MEQWKRVVIDGIEWDYEVCNKEGKVRNMKTGKLKPQHETHNGYLRVCLHKNGKSKSFRVHRLVAEAFIPNPENKPTVNHINENKHDNNVENLEWMTHKEQIHHGTLQERKAKSLQKRVKCIELDKIFDSIEQASRETGCKKSNISYCCRGKRKTTGGYHWEYVD